MNKTMEIFDTNEFKIFAIPAFDGYILVSSGTVSGEKTFYLPAMALIQLNYFIQEQKKEEVG